ncbi:MAG: S1 family peptidase [Marinifilaceae bacterium]
MIKYLSTLLILCSTLTLNAQNKEKLRIIDDLQYNSITAQEATILQKSDNAMSQVRARIQVDTIDPQKKIIIKHQSPKSNKITGDELYQNNIEGVVYLGIGVLTNNSPTLQIRAATGWVLDETGICMTNFHIIENFLNTMNAKILTITTIDQKVYAVTEVLNYSKNEDYAIIKVDTRGDKLKALTIGPDPGAGTPVSIIANPAYQCFYYSQGVVTRHYKNHKKKAEYMQVTADFAQGSSGGPVFDPFGNVVGMVASTLTVYHNPREEKQTQMVLRNCVPMYNMLQHIIQKE